MTKIYKCIEDYPRKDAKILSKGDFMIQENFSTLFRSKLCPTFAIYEFTLLKHKDHFKLINK